jgi:hypothetical protein
MEIVQKVDQAVDWTGCLGTPVLVQKNNEDFQHQFASSHVQKSHGKAIDHPLA